MKENAKYRIYNRLNAFANVIMIAVGGSVGLLIGSSVLKYMDYRDNPVKYEIQSAPWYTGILIGGVLIAVLLVLFIVVKLIALHGLKKTESESGNVTNESDIKQESYTKGTSHTRQESDTKQEDPKNGIDELITPFFWVDNEDSASVCLYVGEYKDELFQTREDEGFEGNGYDWDSLAQVFLTELAPELKEVIDFDSEGSMFCAYSEDKEALRQFIQRFKSACEDDTLIADLFSHAKPD